MWRLEISNIVETLRNKKQTFGWVKEFLKMTSLSDFCGRNIGIEVGIELYCTFMLCELQVDYLFRIDALVRSYQSDPNS
jgi:hypothetical protein